MFKAQRPKSKVLAAEQTLDIGRWTLGFGQNLTPDDQLLTTENYGRNNVHRSAALHRLPRLRGGLPRVRNA